MSDTHRFADRHIGLTDVEAQKILAGLGFATASDLLEAAVPDDIHLEGPLQLPEALTESEALAALRSFADKNQVLTSLIGTGWNNTVTPPVILRNMLENPAWYTAYTPYQPEISQGRLEMLLVFQTMVADLTGCELANASMLDEATAAAEAMTMLRRLDKTKRPGFFVDADCHPQTIAVCQTRAEPLGIQLTVGDPTSDLDPATVYGALISQPGSSGVLRDLGPIIEAVHKNGGRVAVSTDLLACTLITPPGELGADVVVGSAQRFGVPMGFGGPHAGFMATHQSHARALPGRLVGVSIDSSGQPAYRLALQTREQHIRREKATSNICTAQALLANVSAAYACWHGPEGLREIAEAVHGLTNLTRVALASAAPDLTVNESFFDTLTVQVPGKASEVLARGVERGINFRFVDEDHVGMSFDETSNLETVATVVECFAAGMAGALAEPTPGSLPGIPENLHRRTEFLTHPSFHSYRSETEMMRWLRKLADRDLALDRTMIPLGSCTMKLNAVAEMEAITWPEFSAIHPFAPEDQTQGYLELISDLENQLSEITGYDAVSLQPNAGSQGEYAGLLAIRGWQTSRGEGHRDVCLIPTSAHGTNAASAVMAGMRVVAVATNDRGDIDMDDLGSKIQEHADELAA